MIIVIKLKIIIIILESNKRIIYFNIFNNRKRSKFIK